METMTYDSETKRKSPMKRVFNDFFKDIATTQSTALVIDADFLLSATALVDAGVPPSQIHVINTDKAIIDTAVQRGHTNSTVGLSTSVLRTLDSPFDIIYLDYCGFPVRRNDGFDPHFDLLWAACHLKPGGVVAATFSRRATNCVEVAEAMIPRALTYVKGVHYCETSAMFTMILTKGGNAYDLRKLFNRVKIRPTTPVDASNKRPRDTEESPTKKKKRSKVTKPPAKKTVPSKKTDDRLKPNSAVNVKYTMTDGSCQWFPGKIKTIKQYPYYSILFNGSNRSKTVKLPRKSKHWYEMTLDRHGGINI